jgi:hypothetical protein
MHGWPWHYLARSHWLGGRLTGFLPWDEAYQFEFVAAALAGNLLTGLILSVGAAMLWRNLSCSGVRLQYRATTALAFVSSVATIVWLFRIHYSSVEAWLGVVQACASVVCMLAIVATWQVTFDVLASFARGFKLPASKPNTLEG